LWACADTQMTDLTIPFLGPARSRRQYPYASLHRAGAHLAFGSDWSVSTPDPLLQIEVATRRVPPDDRDRPVFIPEERLDLAPCIRAFTLGSAFVNQMDHETGSIEAGKRADLAILDTDIFEPEHEPVGDANVIATLVDGRLVHTSSELDW
jgi:predicted amidohydrolase YtcJ